MISPLTQLRTYDALSQLRPGGALAPVVREWLDRAAAPHAGPNGVRKASDPLPSGERLFRVTAHNQPLNSFLFSLRVNLIPRNYFTPVSFLEFCDVRPRIQKKLRVSLSSNFCRNVHCFFACPTSSCFKLAVVKTYDLLNRTWQVSQSRRYTSKNWPIVRIGKLGHTFVISTKSFARVILNSLKHCALQIDQFKFLQNPVHCFVLKPFQLTSCCIFLVRKNQRSNKKSNKTGTYRKPNLHLVPNANWFLYQSKKLTSYHVYGRIGQDYHYNGKYFNSHGFPLFGRTL